MDTRNLSIPLSLDEKHTEAKKNIFIQEWALLFCYTSSALTIRSSPVPLYLVRRRKMGM